MVAAADVASRAAMERVVAAAEARFGPIHGVFHAAGVAGGGVIALKTPEQAANVLDPKVAGTLVLHEVFSDRPPLDIMLLFSSLAAIFGGPGQVDYCAANAFLDSFAEWRTLQGHGATTSVAWDTWRDVGMAVNTAVPDGLAGDRSQALARGLSTAEALAALSAVLAIPVPRVAIARLDGSTAPQAEAAPTEPRAPATGEGAVRPDFERDHHAPRTETERLLAGIWQELLGVADVGIDDNFFELGGHSLLAIQVVSRIRRALGVELQVVDLFDSPTVAELAARIDFADATEAEIEELLHSELAGQTAPDGEAACHG
jgi:acyl carrier protein